MQTKLISIRVPIDDLDYIDRALLTADGSTRHDAVSSRSDWINKAIVEKRNHADRSRGIKGSRVFKSGETRRGRPVGSGRKILSPGVVEIDSSVVGGVPMVVTGN